MYSHLGLLLKQHEIDGYKTRSSLKMWVMPVVACRDEVGPGIVCAKEEIHVTWEHVSQVATNIRK
jgi:hypothetical protein